MKHVISVLLVSLVWANANLLFAQESVENELEMLRQLNNKKWHDLAKLKIEELLKRNDPVLNAVLPLELARINLAVARTQNPEQRFATFDVTRKVLQDAIQKNPGKLQGVYAAIELARLNAAHAEAILVRAMREEDNKARHEKARPAEQMFIQAGKDFEAAIASVEQAVKDPANATAKADLEEKLQHLRLENVINLFHQARTYVNRSNFDVNRGRSELIAKAQKSFEEVAGREKDSRLGLIATAWLMKCSMELNDPIKVNTHYKTIADKAKDKAFTRAIPEAEKLASYFWMQGNTLKRDNEPETIGENPANVKSSPLERVKGVKEKGLDMEKKYSDLLRSEEGQGIVFELAFAYFHEGTLSKDTKAAAEATQKAEKYFENLGKLNSEIGERARQISLSLQFRRVDLSKGELKTFEDFMMKAMVERDRVRATAGKLEQANPKDTKKVKDLEEERKKHVREVIKSLDTALAMATLKTPVQKIDEARHMLSGAYLANGDPYRAAIAAEALGRTQPPTAKSPDAAATAIATYSALQARHPNDPTLRARLEDLAMFVLSDQRKSAWGTNSVTSLAHYHLAMSAKRDNNPDKAISHLEKLAPDFTDYIYTQGQLVFIAQAAREKTDDKDKKKHKFYIDAAKEAIKRMPAIDPKESPSVVAMYFFAKMEQAKFVYAEAVEDLNAREGLKAVKKCNEMSAYVRGLLGEFEKIPVGKLSKENHEQIQFSMFVMLKYADLGVAEVKFRGDGQNRFDEVIATTQNTVNDMLARAKAAPGGEPIRLKDFRVTGDILGLALRAQVQKGNVAQAKSILDVLKRVTNEKGDASAGNVVNVLLNDIAGQVQRMKTEKDPGLKLTKINYTIFLDEISKDYETRGTDNNTMMMIAHAYSSLELPQKAAIAFGKVKPPATLNKKIDKKPNPKETEAEAKARLAWEDEVRRYWGAQVEYVRALRACKDKESRKTAEKVLVSLLTHENARYQIQAMMERNYLLEDEQRYRDAYGEWSKKFLVMPALKNRGDKDVADVYFKGYFYMTRTLYMTAMYDPTVKERKRFVNASAKLIIQLEFAEDKKGWELVGPLYQELLKAEQPLKDEYDLLKAEKKKAALPVPVPAVPVAHARLDDRRQP